MLKLSWKFGESKWYPYWVIVLTSSSGTNYVPNEHEGVDQYGSFSIPSKLVMRRISLLSLAGSHFTHRWSGLQGPLNPSPSASTGCTPRISLPNYGKNLCTNTVEVLISYKIFQRIWLCKWISIFCKTAKYDLLDWERYPVISHQRIR